MEHEIAAYAETPVPGTGLIVYHQGDEESFVHTLPDGRVQLCGPYDWYIRVGAAPADAPPVAPTGRPAGWSADGKWFGPMPSDFDPPEGRRWFRCRCCTGVYVGPQYTAMPVGEEKTACLEHERTCPAGPIVVRWDDDEHVTIIVRGDEIAAASHDEHGWDGMGAVIDLAKKFAAAYGVELRTEGSPNL